MGAISKAIQASSAISDLQHPSGWLTDIAGGTSAAGVNVTDRKALGVSSVFACVRNLAEDEAKLPLPVYEDMGADGRVKRKDYPLYSILNYEANDNMTAFNARQAITACAALYGRGYARIVRDGRMEVTALIPLMPAFVTLLRRPEDNEFYYVIRSRNGKTEVVSPAEIFELTGFGFNGILGEMITKVGRNSLGLSIAADQFASSFFANGTNPGGHLTYPGKADKALRKKIRNEIKEQHGGAENGHQLLMLWDGITFTATEVDVKKSQSVESRQFNVEDIARWFRMPPHKIGHLKRATGWSTLEATNRDYLTDTMMPWGVRWEQEIRRKLIKRSDQNTIYVEHLYDALLAPDAKTRAEIQAIRFVGGQLSLDEIAVLENRPPVGGEVGSTRWLSTNLAPADQLVQDPAPEVVPDNNNRVQAAYERLFVSAVDSLLRKESKAVARLAKKHPTDRTDFDDSVREFYSGHKKHIREAFSSLILSYDEITAGDIDTQLLIGDLVARHVEKSLSDTSNDDIDAALDAWAVRPAQEAKEIMAIIATR